MDLCTRCGSFVCPECVDYRGAAPWCTSCLHLVPGGPSRRARVSPALAGLGVLGLLGGLLVPGRPGLALWALALPLGFAGLATGLQETAALARREAPEAGRRWARLGRALGLLHAFLAVCLITLFVTFLRRWAAP